MFEPLKDYFDSFTNRPVSIGRVFAENSTLFWLTFADSQLKLSIDYILKTETREIAAFEVAALVKKLRMVIAKRLREKETLHPMRRGGAVQ